MDKQQQEQKEEEDNYQYVAPTWKCEVENCGWIGTELVSHFEEAHPAGGAAIVCPRTKDGPSALID